MERVEPGAGFLVVRQVVQEVEAKNGEEHDANRRQGEVSGQQEGEDEEQHVVLDLLVVGEITQVAFVAGRRVIARHDKF